MPRSSPPTRRVVEIIELLTERHGDTTRLSDIVKALNLNQATAHTIMNELTDAGWIIRDPVNKTFSIGAALVSLVKQIDPAPGGLHAAALSATADTGYASSVSERAGLQLVILSFTSSDDGRNDQWHPEIGDRVPFAAPFGPAIAAWESQSEQRAWIQRCGVSNRAFHAQLERFLADTFDRGFAVERMSPEMVSAIPVMTKLQAEAVSDSMRDHLDQVLLEMTGAPATSADARGRQRHYVGAISAPVLNLDGRATHNISVHPFADLSSRKIEQIGRRLRSAADRISSLPPT
jgi:DNA-binding IclR family transcriptional regulator